MTEITFRRWTFFDREDTRKLGPVYDSGLDPVFKVDPVEDKETVSSEKNTSFLITFFSK